MNNSLEFFLDLITLETVNNEAATGIDTGDFNGDGFEDIVVAEYDGRDGSVGVLLSNLNNSNPPNENKEIIGTEDDDTLVGNSQDNLIQGLGRRDLLEGKDGADGLDTLIGGGGRDRFFLRVDAGTDTIVDFETDLDKFVLGHNLNFEQLSLVANGSDTEIQVIATEETIAIVTNISPNNLNITDFV